MVTSVTSAQDPSGTNAVENVISVKGLTKVFKDFWGRSKAKAVNNVNFEVRRWGSGDTEVSGERRLGWRRQWDWRFMS